MMSDEAITFRKFDHHLLNTHPVSSKPIGDAFTFTSVWRRWNSSQQLDTDSVLAEGVLASEIVGAKYVSK